MARHTIPTRPSDRGAILTQRRRRKMARSAHAYVRGNTERFYEWLQADTQRALPQGPSIWICGDCHVGNLGPVVDGDGRVGVLIRDLDQAVIGNPAHDLVRLGLSLACACRSADLPGVMSLRVVDMLLDGYARAFAQRPRPPRRAPHPRRAPPAAARPPPAVWTTPPRASSSWAKIRSPSNT